MSDLLGTVINRSNEIAMLEKILRTTEMNNSNSKEILKILRTLQEIETESDIDETLFKKLLEAISVNIPFTPVNLDLGKMHKIVKSYRLDSKKRL